MNWRKAAGGPPIVRPAAAGAAAFGFEEFRPMETTLIILKPDAVQRGLMGRIVARFEDKGLQIVGCKLAKIPVSTAETHYKDHKGKPFYDGLVKFMTSSPVLIMAV